MPWKTSGDTDNQIQWGTSGDTYEQIPLHTEYTDEIDDIYEIFGALIDEQQGQIKQMRADLLSLQKDVTKLQTEVHSLQ